MPRLELPPCRWRGSETGEGRYPCASPKLVVSPAGVPAEACLRCYCRDHAPAAPAAPASPCRHLGAATGETAECPACPNGPAAGARRVPLLACAVHGATTGRRGAPGRRSCFRCPDYTPG